MGGSTLGAPDLHARNILRHFSISTCKKETCLVRPTYHAVAGGELFQAYLGQATTLWQKPESSWCACQRAMSGKEY